MLCYDWIIACGILIQKTMALPYIYIYFYLYLFIFVTVLVVPALISSTVPS